MISLDTNLLVMLLVEDDEKQAAKARDLRCAAKSNPVSRSTLFFDQTRSASARPTLASVRGEARRRRPWRSG